MEHAMNYAPWHFNPVLLLPVFGLYFLYYLAGVFQTAKSTLLFTGTVFLLTVTECSPLHRLAMHAYFSAHMIIHVLLLLVYGPLLVISIPKNQSPAPERWIYKCSIFLTRHKWTAWLTGVGMMWFWHIPTVFNASMQNGLLASFLMILQPITLLAGGIIFSWPIIGPVRELRIHPLTGIIYLASACAGCSLLGLLITFAPAGTYPQFTLMQMAGNPWHQTAMSDQQTAGLIMWVPCCFVYLTGCLWLIARWFGSVDVKVINNINQLTHADGNRK